MPQPLKNTDYTYHAQAVIGHVNTNGYKVSALKKDLAPHPFLKKSAKEGPFAR